MSSPNASVTAPATPIEVPSTQTSTIPVVAWLFACAGMVFVMVVLGGLTRLTDSGLSMMAWKPLSFLPPMTDAEWLFWFDTYKQVPQYQNLFPTMTLTEFKGIFWLEYLHRLWGRILGLVFLLPFVWFVWRRAIGRGLALKLLGIFALGGLQGLMGWYMVASGFHTDLAVSHYRLAAHLMLAVAIFGALLWVAFDLLSPKAKPLGHCGLARLRRRYAGILALLCITLVSGAFVAGLRAGRLFNTFPLMGDSFVPPGLGAISPLWRNLVENMVTVQFTHRLLALSVLGLVFLAWALTGRDARAVLTRRARLAVTLVPIAALGQVALGVATLLLFVPVSLGAAHQAFAFVLFGALLWALHELRGARA